MPLFAAWLINTARLIGTLIRAELILPLGLPVHQQRDRRGGVDRQQGRQYDVGPDGRFLINILVDSAAAPITLLMNWKPEGKN